MGRPQIPAPGPPIFTIPLEPSGPGAGGTGTCVPLEPLPLLLSSLRHGRPKEQEHVANQPLTHAAPRGAADFPCLRQLPPPPEKK